MKIAGIILLILVLIGCGTGLILMSLSLGATQERLEDTEAALVQTQVEQQDTARSLEETRSELQATTRSLEDTRQGLEDQKVETDKYIALYETSTDELENREKELGLIEDRLTKSEMENEDLQKTIDEVQEKLALYEDTLGIQVFSGETVLHYASGNVSSLKLVNQSTAKNPTWDELLQFLREDKTDKKLYVPGEYECGNFAQELHNNAEAYGIRAALVAVHFQNSDQSHALNAFKTTDKGLVYIDDTGFEEIIYTSNLDAIVTMSKDEIYRKSFLFITYLYYKPIDWIVRSIEIYW
jgi:hypothetical protein